ncbi:MAG TPA: type II toxin-antitoxin system RelE/ParE family toxin [Steroidobacteraceae bacterium]|nr:type II toxin-antitoxin system RelE/ParE family toxin [Steroidobacteraceae bacterium]
MIEILKTGTFSEWFEHLEDHQAKRIVQAKIDRLAVGGFGNAKRLSSILSELKIDHGPGYRVYFTHRGSMVVILLCGGNKSTQKRDIQRAHLMAKNLSLEG